jgi:hypothetical protein
MQGARSKEQGWRPALIVIIPDNDLASVKNGLSQADSSGFGDKMVPEMVNFIAELFAKK